MGVVPAGKIGNCNCGMSQSYAVAARDARAIWGQFNFHVSRGITGRDQEFWSWACRLMPQAFPSTAQSALIVGRTPGPQLTPPSARRSVDDADFIGEKRVQGVRPTISAGFAGLAKSLGH